MQPFTVVAGAAAPLLRDNIDTDLIIRVERLTGTAREEMGPWAFETLRYRPDGTENPDFVLNRPGFRGAPILLAGSNFGCGSSREGAVWALMGSGLRCVIAPSFGDIFVGNCFQNGMLPVRLPVAEVERLAGQCAEPGREASVDLERQAVGFPDGSTVPFDIEPIRREALLAGLDEIGLTLAQLPAIEAFQAADRQRRPWVWALQGA